MISLVNFLPRGFSGTAAFHRLGQRRVFQHVSAGIAGGEQRRPQRAGLDVGTLGARPVRGAARAGRERQRSVDMTNDVGEADVLGRARQQEAALLAAVAEDEVAAAQLGEDLLEKRAGDFCFTRERADGNRAFIAMAREADHRPQCVFGPL
jgi:hypothetical protein